MRPLLQFSAIELAEHLAIHGSNRAELESLKSELQRRSSKPAAELLRRVEAAIASLPRRETSDGALLDRPAFDGSGPTTVTREAAQAVPEAGSVGWDRSQSTVISASSDSRLLVDAGPGTGKTAVACARVAHLIASGVEASNIWLISFTRTAVQEIRNRIRALVDQEALANAVRITTLDAHAWRMVAGFESDSHNLFAGYDGTIGGAIQLLKHPTDEVAEYLRSVEHLVVDEAQDLVGIRADLVELHVTRIDPTSGVTILCDEAQAIYGFSENETPDYMSVPLTRRIVAGACGQFARHSLSTVHRTETPGLHSIFTLTRGAVLAPGPAGIQKLRRVREEIVGKADGRVGMVTDQDLKGRDDTLVLFRRRVEVLMASSYLSGTGVQHRLRMSGLPTCIPPWVALCLSDCGERWLTRDDFLSRFEERTAGFDALTSADKGWQLLLEVGGTRQGRIDTRLLRARLSGSRPPVSLCSHEVGVRGPIVGTIHASKGRESGVVHLMLPEALDGMEGDFEEETRVLFVGATRARIALRTGDAISISAGATQTSKRCFRSLPPRGVPRAQVEFGREGDVDLKRQVATSLFAHPADVRASQDILCGMISNPCETSAWSVAADNFCYHLRAGATTEGTVIGALNPSLNTDLYEISRSCGVGRRRVRLPAVVRHIRCVGVRTVAVAPDDPIVPTLHTPYCDSGFFLAPVIVGFTTIQFHDARQR